MSEKVNLELRVLVTEHKALYDGIRSGVRGFCSNLYSKELIPDDVQNFMSHDSASEDYMVEKVLSTLQDRVKVDPSSFNVILTVLRNTVSMSYLAERLENKLTELKEEYTKKLKAEDNLSKEKQKRQSQEMVINLHPMPIYLGNSDTTLRDAISGPAVDHGNMQLPLSFFTNREENFISTEQASSVGAEGHSLAYLSPRKASLYQDRFQSDTPTSEVMGFLPIGKNEPNTCLETGMNTPMSTQNRQLESPILHGSERAKMYDDDSKRMFPSLVNINTTGEMNVPIKITGSTESKSELPNRTEKEDTATSEGVKHRISVPVCQATDNANSLLHGNAPIHKRTPSSNSNNSDSTEFRTPPNTPPPKNKSNHQTSETLCSKCLNESYMNSLQIENLKKELNAVEQEKSHSKSRIKEQEMIIAQLNSWIKKLLLWYNPDLVRKEDSERVRQLTKDLEREREEKERERIEKEREQEEKERERMEKDRERHEKDRERYEKMREREEKMRERKEKKEQQKLKEEALELNEKMQMRIQELEMILRNMQIKHK